MSIGKRLAKLRAQRGITQQELIEMVGFKNRASYALYEIGRREPGYDTLCKLADFFGVTTDFLLGQTPAKEDNVDTYKFDGRKLRERRKSRKLTIEALADLTGIPSVCINNYEKMQETPNEATTQRLADALGVSDLHFFVDGVLDIRDIIPDINNKSLEFIVDPSKYEYIVAAHKYFEDGISPEAMDSMRHALLGVYGKKKKQTLPGT